jgi:hypothetical protein
MATEFTVVLENVPGTLAKLGQVLGEGRVNIDAIHGTCREGRGAIQFVADDVDRAAAALNGAGIPYTTRDVIIVKVLDEPGTLGDVALVFADARINIDTVYVTTRGHVVFGVDDLDGAIHVAGSMAVMTSD